MRGLLFSRVQFHSSVVLKSKVPMEVATRPKAVKAKRFTQRGNVEVLTIQNLKASTP